jgi:hypothetical protein
MRGDQTKGNENKRWRKGGCELAAKMAMLFSALTFLAPKNKAQQMEVFPKKLKTWFMGCVEN